VQVSRYPIPD